MAQILVTPSELRSAAATLRDYNANFKSRVEDLTTSEGTLNSQWEGQAKEAFHAAFMTDKAFMDQFAAEIEKYCQALETIATKYATAEQTNAETASTRRS